LLENFLLGKSTQDLTPVISLEIMLILVFGFGDLVLALYLDGFSLRQISALVGKSHMTVYRHLKPVLARLGIPFRPAHRLKKPKGKRGRRCPYVYS